MNRLRVLSVYVLAILVVNMTASVFMSVFVEQITINEIDDCFMDNLFEVDREFICEECHEIDECRNGSVSRGNGSAAKAGEDDSSNNDIEESLYDAIDVSENMTVYVSHAFLRVAENKTEKIDNLDEFKIEAYA